MVFAAVLMLLAPQQKEPPPRDPVLDGLKFLLSHQQEDGSWGAPPPACTCRPAGAPAPRDGDLESTAWAILAFSGAGYTELAVKDEFNGRNVGKAVRSALDWLVSKQDMEGAFDRNDPAVNAIAAVALTETYGMTVQRKDAAVKAYVWVEKSAIPDVVGRIRQGMVLQSGKCSEIGEGQDAKLVALADALEKQEGDLARWGSLLLRGYARQKRAIERAEDAKGDPVKLAPEALNVFATATYLCGEEERWHEWFRGMKDILVPAQRGGKDLCEAGSWDRETPRDRIRTTAIRCLTLQHYRCFSCRNVFRKK